MPFLTGGFPDMAGFARHAIAAAEVADVLEVGVPFSDPMADGVSIQRASHVALENGATLRALLGTLADLGRDVDCPVLLMSYLNPLLAYGIPELGRDARAAGVSGFIVPDLPLEESDPMRDGLADSGLALVQLVTPVTPAERIERIAAASSGFLYAVTIAGTTGATLDPDTVLDYLDSVRQLTDLPVCSGFGIRGPEHVARLRDHVDGVIVGTALIDAIERGECVRTFLSSLLAPTGRGRESA